jgi:transcriptional regulator with XRE-family HTH domain
MQATELEKTPVPASRKYNARPEFTDYLRKQREVRGWSARELAAKAGVGNSLIASYENPEYVAERELEAGKLIKIANALNTDPNHPFVTPVKLLYLAGYDIDDPDKNPIVWPPEVERLARFILNIKNARLREKAVKIAINAARTFLGLEDD